MKQAKVSIIIPCWGVEKYLNRCMESVVNQTLRDIEIILVDDESPDHVPEMCDEWAKKDSRVKVVHKKNEGLGYARNTGLELASGEYVAFVDSDDYIRKDAYSLYYEAAIANDADVVFAGINTEVQPGVWKRTFLPPELSVLDKDESWQYAKDMVASLPYVKCERRNSMSVWHSIYKLSIIKENGIKFLSERDVVSEDLPFQLDYMKNVNKTVLIPDALYYYCLNSNSLSVSFKVEKFERQMTLRQELLKRMGNDSESLLRANRKFIAASRVYTEKLSNSKIKGKIGILHTMLDNRIWRELKAQYKPSYLGLYQSIIYRLQINHHSILLLLFASCAMKAKRMIGKKTY